MHLSIVIPAHNEAEALPALLTQLRSMFSEAEIVVVDDGSTDATPTIAMGQNAVVVRHPRCLGNGASIKTGARKARGDVLVFMDADGQHHPADIHRLLAKINEGYYMAVGARSSATQASWPRRIANLFYNWLASVMTGHEILDLTSGFRAVRARRFRKFLYLLPNGFSYPTTSTMAFFRAGFPVAYVPIEAGKRQGKSKIRWLQDGTRFCLIILKVGALFSPMRFFLPISLMLFGCGLGLYSYTFLSEGRFTNMGALLFMSALFNFLIGIVSEQISSLHYRDIEGRGDESSDKESIDFAISNEKRPVSIHRHANSR